MAILSDIVLFAAMAMLLFIALRDFQTLRILNKHVLVMIGLYTVYAVLTGFADWRGDLTAGGILFGMSFVFWLLGMIGAGDVKLYLPLGFFLGMQGLMPYAILLLITSVLLLALVKLGGRWSRGRTAFGRRLQELRAAGKVPYGVPMGVSGMATMALMWVIGF